MFQGNMWLCSVLPYVHQLVADIVCLLFGARKVAQSEFLKLKTAAMLPENNTARAVRMDQNSGVEDKIRL